MQLQNDETLHNIDWWLATSLNEPGKCNQNLDSNQRLQTRISVLQNTSGNTTTGYWPSSPIVYIKQTILFLSLEILTFEVRLTMFEEGSLMCHASQDTRHQFISLIWMPSSLQKNSIFKSWSGLGNALTC